jgi:hypothetical protein
MSYAQNTQELLREFVATHIASASQAGLGFDRAIEGLAIEGTPGDVFDFDTFVQEMAEAGPLPPDLAAHVTQEKYVTALKESLFALKSKALKAN